MIRPNLIEHHRREDGSQPGYSSPEQFHGAAISNYEASEWQAYDYTESKINAYYRSILEMAD